jgi:hypothetical protein
LLIFLVNLRILPLQYMSYLYVCSVYLKHVFFYSILLSFYAVEV